MKEKEYFTAGEMARKMNVSVRTLQYYDREQLLRPSAFSDGGRRLYTYRDMVQLHQILCLKNLGFSLAEIREKLLPLDSPQEVAAVLSEQAAGLRAQIRTLERTLDNLEKLRAEVLGMQEVDFRCYADIVVNLQMNNDLYWVLKFMDADTRNRMRQRFDRERADDFLQQFSALQEQAAQLAAQQTDPGSSAGQAVALQFWELIQTFTGGDPGTLRALISLHDIPAFRALWEQRASAAFLEAALETYLGGLHGSEQEENKP